MVQVRYIARFAYGESLAEDRRNDGAVPVFGSNGEVGRHDKSNTSAPVLVIGRKGSFGKVNYSDISVFSIDTTFYVDSTLSEANLRWLYYALSTLGLDLLSEDVGVPGLSREKAYGLRLPLPPRHAQHAIADYLDAETARIDALIEKKRRMVQLLEEVRISVMTAGVNGTLTSPSTEESDLPWLDRQGEGWRTAKLNLVARLGTGHTPSRDHDEWWTNCTVPWITTGEVAQMRSDRIEFIEDTREKISHSGIANSSAVIHPAGSVVLCRTASAGYSAIMAVEMATSQDFAVWTCGPQLRPRFLLLCLRVMRQDLLGRLAMGSTHKTIYMPDIESLRIPLPSVVEQSKAVEEVWSRLRNVDQLILHLEAEIGLVIERRHALVTAAVKGELDIPGAAA